MRTVVVRTSSSRMLILANLDKAIEWLHEGDAWSENWDRELRTRLLEIGVLRPGKNGLRISFVGVIIFRDRTFVALPKIRVSSPAKNIHQIAMRAMRRYREWIPTHHEPSPYLNESPDKGPITALAAADWMIRDFASYGLLRRTEVTHEINGGGLINWQRTAESVGVIISRGRPVYFETVTRRSQIDNENFATRLHCYLLEWMSDAYAQILDLEPINLDHEPIERFQALPPIEECEARLGIEQRSTYSQRGIDLLAMMLAAVRSIEAETELGLSLFGTSSFYHIWELACGRAFKNEANIWQPFIPRPRWTAASGQSADSDTFIPDLVSPLDQSELLIGDAKYYRPVMPPMLQNVPGVNDIAKQIWYKECLKKTADQNGFTSIQNVFLFPADVHEMMMIGLVELPAGSERVDAVALPFIETLSVYSGDKLHDLGDWRKNLSNILRKNGNLSEQNQMPAKPENAQIV